MYKLLTSIITGFIAVLLYFMNIYIFASVFKAHYDDAKLYSIVFLIGFFSMLILQKINENKSYTKLQSKEKGSDSEM